MESESEATRTAGRACAAIASKVAAGGTAAALQGSIDRTRALRGIDRGLSRRDPKSDLSGVRIALEPRSSRSAITRSGDEPSTGRQPVGRSGPLDLEPEHLFKPARP